MLSIRNLTIKYNQQNPILKDFCLEVKPREIISIVGESGSGKTTAIRAIMGLLPENSSIEQGEILFGHKDLLTYSKKQWHELRGKQLAMIFQDTGAMLNPNRKIGHQFVEYIRAHEKLSKKEAWQKATLMLRQMSLPHSERVMNSYGFELSGGMRQRVGIAMAMTFKPALLLADEPTSALDVTTQAEIVGEMMAIRKQYGTSIIMVTHNLGVAAHMSDRIIVMKEGQILEAGSSEVILKHPKSEYTKALLASVPTLEGEQYV